MYLAAVALAAASPAPVEVVSHEVVLRRHDRAPIEVRCNRRTRACRGVLSLGVAQCGGPALSADCLVELGRRRFTIPPRTTRPVRVRRTAPSERAADGPDAVEVRATPFLRRPRSPWATRWTRSVRLVAPPGLVRAPLRLELREAERLQYDRHAIRFSAGAPLGTSSLRVELAGRTLDLHPRGSRAYVVGPRSFAVAGALWHGELPVAEGELREGESHPWRLTACDASRCTQTSGEITLERDRTRDPQPICRLRPLTAVA